MATASARTPWHLWLVGLIGLAWNGFGVSDYVQTKLVGADYMKAMGMTEAQIAYMNAMPAWSIAIWALGVTSALLGTVLLLLRKRAAAPVFAASLLFYLASLLYTYVLSNGGAVMSGAVNTVMQMVILAGCLFFAGYSRAMAKAGVLR
jgi:hypothetical protein